MKKVACLLVALLLCFTAVAFAEEAVPSKTVENLTVIKAENVTIAVAEDQAKVDVCNAEITKLGATTPAEYFAGVDFAAVLGTADVKVYEFVPVTMTGYDEAAGDVKATLTFATPYAADSKVVVMVGLVDGEAITWTALEATVNAEGAVEVVFPAALMTGIQNGTALLAVVSA